MTPLFQRIARELTLPRKDRTFEDNCGLLGMLDDVHCFEVTEVFPLIQELAQEIMEAIRKSNMRLSLMAAQGFLPAPKTWIERLVENGTREGFLLTHNPLERHARVYLAGANAEHFCSMPEQGKLLLKPNTDDVTNPEWTTVLRADGGGDTPVWASAYTALFYALLAVINTPRIIGRRQHMPHRGLEKALVRELGVGKFPLHAWTELVLSMKFKEAGGEEHEAHLTGQRCLHFCRAHLRVREGQLQFVRAHWRGDPALGMKRTRYRLTT